MISVFRRGKAGKYQFKGEVHGLPAPGKPLSRTPKKMTNEELYWHRVKNLWDIYNRITDDLVYKAMWEKKLKELMERGFNGQ